MTGSHIILDRMLRNAAALGKNDKVKETLRLGADIHAWNENALSAAAFGGHNDTIELLLSCGADIHTTNNDVLSSALSNSHWETIVLLLRHGADTGAKHDDGKSISENSGLINLMGKLKQSTSAHFKSGKPSRKQCFSAGALRDEVLNACVTGQFATLIGAPMVASTDKADRKLFQDIWEALPSHWQDQNQNIYMQFMKEGGINPIVGTHTSVTQRDSLAPDMIAR